MAISGVKKSMKQENSKSNKTKSDVKEYYGTTLNSTSDLKTNACCTQSPYPKHIKDGLAKIHDEVHSKYYGCGLTIPHNLNQKKVLDLGSGAGRDCYLLSQLVGETGEVVGVDMTPEQLLVAREYIPYHMEKFGYKTPNVKFLEGDIENLAPLKLESNYFDVIVSNCVINLATDKKSVLSEAYRTLKNGGELYFSDVYADRRVPVELTKDPVLYGECLSGALYWNDFQNLSKEVGFIDPRAVSSEKIEIHDPEIKAKVGDIEFFSITYRLFKLPELEKSCEDYGQEVTYKGTLQESKEAFILDSGHTFKNDEKVKVCGNSYRMLNESRFNKHFEFSGNWDSHLGIYEGSAPTNPLKALNKPKVKSSCC